MITGRTIHQGGRGKVSSYTRGMCYTITPFMQEQPCTWGWKDRCIPDQGKMTTRGGEGSVSPVKGKSTHVTLLGGVMFLLNGGVG